MQINREIFLTWLGLFVIGFANGALRELFIVRFVKKTRAQQISVLTAIIFFTLFIFAIWSKLSITSIQDAAIAGTIWFILTLLTEIFLLNRWMGKMSWEQIGETYNVFHGEFWPLVLLWVGVLPVVMFFLKAS